MAEKQQQQTPIGVALKEAERGASKSGSEARVYAVLEEAKNEISSSSSLKPLWVDAAEFTPKKGLEIPRDVYERAQLKMADALGVHEVVEGHVVGHALMRACEGGHLRVVNRLRKGQAELRCSILAPRFLAFALLKASEMGHLDVVEDLLRITNSAQLAMVGYELATKWKDDGYPYVIASLTRNWNRKLSTFKSMLPGATYAVHYGNLELCGSKSDQESVHEAVRSCYQIYCLWRLMMVSGANGHSGVFRELLKKRDEFDTRAGESREMLMGHAHPEIDEIARIRTGIDAEFMRFAMKVMAKLSKDTLLYELYRSQQGTSYELKKGNAWRCTSKAQFGLWEVQMEVPVMLMEPEGSYQDGDHKKQQLMRNYRYVKPIIPQIMKLNLQFKVLIDFAQDHADLTLGVNHVRVTVENQCWEEAQTGHFPTRVSLSVTPVAPTLTSVSMTGSSTNTSYKVGVAENIRIGVGVTLKSVPTAGISFQAGTGMNSKMDGKPWRMEQLPVYNERGGSYTWALTNLHGAPFDRLSPMLEDTKKSIWQFGKRVPINPLLVLPFGTNGGVNFTGSEFDDTVTWRFAKELENSMLEFNVEGQIHTTFFTQDTFWETRVVPFEVKLEQKLEPCGDPGGGDKKKKKKKK